MIVKYDEIMALYPSNTHRVSRSFFRANEPKWSGECGGGVMVQGLCYVLLGQVVYQFNDQKIEISEGESKELPGGEYSLYLGEGDIEIVNVWPLFPEFIALSRDIDKNS